MREGGKEWWWGREGGEVGEGLSWEEYLAEKKGLRQMASSSYDSQYYIEKRGEGGREGVVVGEGGRRGGGGVVMGGISGREERITTDGF